MHESLIFIYEKFIIFWHRKFLALGIAFLLCFSGWTFVYFMPNIYEARARIYVDTENFLQPLLKGITVDLDHKTKIELIFKNLLSRTRLEKIARAADLDLNVKNDEEFDNMILELGSKIRTIKLDNSHNLYRLVYKNKDPIVAQKVLEESINAFIEELLGDSRLERKDAKDFLDKQIKDYEQRLIKDETNLALFKKEHVGFLPNDSGNYYKQLVTQRKLLEENLLKLKESQSEYKTSKIRLSQAKKEISEQKNTTKTISKYDQRIEILEQKLDEMELLYTEQYPELIKLKTTLAGLYNHRNLETIKNNQPKSIDYSKNTYISELKLEISTTAAKIAALKVRTNNYELKIIELEELIAKVPEVEAKLAALSRGYEITKTKYEQLLLRSETANIGSNAQLKGDAIKFEIIDNAKTLPHPVAPNKSILILGVLASSLVFACAFVILLNEINPKIYIASQLKKDNNFQILGSISQISLPWQNLKRKLETIVFVTLFILLIVFYVVAVFKISETKFLG